MCKHSVNQHQIDIILSWIHPSGRLRACQIVPDLHLNMNVLGLESDRKILKRSFHVSWPVTSYLNSLCILIKQGWHWS